MQNCGFVRLGRRRRFFISVFMVGEMGRIKSIGFRLSSRCAGRLPVLSGRSGSARSVKGKSSTARGYGYRWQRERKEFLAENPLCAMCSTDLSPVEATVVDHITPHGGDDGLFWDRSNWQSLCKHCHDSAKQRKERGDG